MDKSTKIFLCFLITCSAGNVFCKDIPTEGEKAFGQNCDKEYSVTCVKLKIVSLIENLSDKKEYMLYPGVSIVREVNASDPKTSEIVAEVARNFPNDPEKRLDGYLVAKVGNFLQSLTLKWSLLDSTEDASAVFSGRKGKIGKKGGLEAIIAAGMMMKGTLMAVAMGGLALLAGKALMTGLMALLLSGIVGLKSLAHGGSKSTTYEIVAKPVYQNSHSHSVSHEDVHGGGGGGGGGHGHSGYGGYGRSLNYNNLPSSEHLAKTGI